MEYVNLGRSGLKVSQMCLGTWHLPRSHEKDKYGIPKVDVEETKRVVRVAFDRGLNFIDTANRYHGAMAPVDAPHFGNAERILGDILRAYHRESFVVATKVAGEMAEWPNAKGLSRKHIIWQAKESLGRLGFEYLDVYLVHMPDPETPHRETLMTFNDLVRTGRVHYIGASNMSPEEVIDFMMLADEYRITGFVVLQEKYNLFARTLESTLVPIARKFGLSIMAYSPLAQGLLSEKYLSGVPPESRATYFTPLKDSMTEPMMKAIGRLSELAKDKGITLPQLALSWMLYKQKSLGVSVIPIIGVSSVQQLTDNLQALDVRLSEEDVRTAEAIAASAQLQ